jgi:hypothetical protein
VEPSGRITRSQAKAVPRADSKLHDRDSTTIAAINLRKRNAAKEPKYAKELLEQHALEGDEHDQENHSQNKDVKAPHKESQICLSARSKRLKLAEETDARIPDLDTEDLEDPAMCAEYAQEIMDYLMDREVCYLL